MNISADVLRTHIDYTAWASSLLVAAAAQLTEEELRRDYRTAHNSVLNTLVHIFAADRVWLGRIQGNPPPAFVTEADHHLLVLQNDWPELHQRWKQWALGLTDSTAGNLLSYSDLTGNRWQQPLWQILLHVVNHATHHRGQVIGFLRAMGHSPPKLDLVFYHRLPGNAQ